MFFFGKNKSFFFVNLKSKCWTNKTNKWEKFNLRVQYFNGKHKRTRKKPIINYVSRDSQMQQKLVSLSLNLRAAINFASQANIFTILLILTKKWGKIFVKLDKTFN